MAQMGGSDLAEPTVVFIVAHPCPGFTVGKSAPGGGSGSRSPHECDNQIILIIYTYGPDCPFARHLAAARPTSPSSDLLHSHTHLPLYDVCKQFHALITSSLLLQYRIELAADGLVDGPSGGPASTTAARMELLLERRAAWRALRPSRRAAVALAGHFHAYELVGGLFAKALEEFGAARRLVASWLPSNAAGETRLVVDDLGVRTKDFALDPAQELIVLLEHRPAVGPIASTSTSAAAADIRVHLRKLSAGAIAPHLAARNPVLCWHGLGPVHGCMIQIVEDVVGMYFWMPFHGVLIWNWMTGEELVAPERIWDFSFLSPQVYMVTTLKDGGESRIYSFANSSSPKRPLHVATLHLPPPYNHRGLLELTTTTGPFLACPPANMPFASGRDARVHVFTLHHDLAARMFRGAQPDADAIHGRLSRGSGRGGRAMGAMGSKRDTLLRARDRVPVASVSFRLMRGHLLRPIPAPACSHVHANMARWGRFTTDTCTGRLWCAPCCSPRAKAGWRFSTLMCTRRGLSRRGKGSRGRVWGSIPSGSQRARDWFASRPCSPRGWCL
ncbi:hypothetical protein F5148DRAFT_746642 [Russula earlei]|uniref:Uncharacterized protein n=1 Tax=Russula earlei TaxID=71964 RepID=A0ACC0TU83_9AGAM|nr:hypothetical protein F5148DRAFT_746642 [Russula earlei]